MDQHVLTMLKRAPLRPNWRNDYNYACDKTKADTYLKHPDLPGVEFKSESALRKVYRVQRYAKNTLSKRNNYRLDNAIRRILDANRLDANMVAKAMIADRVAKLVMPDTTDLSGMLERIVREEVAKALKGKKGLNEYIAEIALAEAKRIILENLSFDAKACVDVFAPRKGARAIKLGSDE